MNNLLKEFYDTIKTWKKLAETAYRYDPLGRDTKKVKTGLATRLKSNSQFTI